MRFTNKVSLLAMILILFCFVVILSSCHDAETTVPDTTTVPVTTAFVSTIAPDTTTMPTTTESIRAILEKVELDYLEDPESFFFDPDETKYKCDENGDIIMRIVLNLKTIAEYEAFVEKYEMEDAFICASTLFDFASYIELGVGSLEELLVYAVAPEVWYICVPPTAENQSWLPLPLFIHEPDNV